MKQFSFYMLLSLSLMSCGTSYNTITYFETSKNADSLDVHEGILCQHAQKIKYKRGGKEIAIITLSEPVLVAMADQEESWGYFQFPSIGKSEDGTLRISWQMLEDSHNSYGKNPERKIVPMMSINGGKTWFPRNKIFTVRTKGYSVYLRNGNVLQVSTQSAKSIKGYNFFPNPVAIGKTYTYYLEKDLPESLRGFYLNQVEKSGSSTLIHAKLNDPGLVRYAIDGQMPIVWWGDIKELSDGTLVAGVYPTNYLDDKGGVTRGSVSFYESNDGGGSWDILSKIPFFYDGIANVRGNMSFEEPAFEVLPDSTFLCIMRSGATSPMYRTFSKDKGRTWTIPEPFTPNGVKPSLLTLQNGSLVLTSGRPGIQIRISFDGGINWTDAIDMIPFMNKDGSFIWDVSCGYASIIDAGKNSFYLTYSDFTTINEAGEKRKSIWFRKVEVKRKINAHKYF